MLPSLGGIVKVVNGANRGAKAALQAVDVDKYVATIKLLDVGGSRVPPAIHHVRQGPNAGKVAAGVPYEDMSKWADT